MLRFCFRASIRINGRLSEITTEQKDLAVSLPFSLSKLSFESLSPISWHIDEFQENNELVVACSAPTVATP